MSQDEMEEKQVSLASSMLVTDVGGQIFWQQGMFRDVGDVVSLYFHPHSLNLNLKDLKLRFTSFGHQYTKAAACRSY